ncbi:MAG: hypothetical protein A2096_11205 [Spirochaetes bacterium GWF1_41_5]|nr:MAG: hypothetical protein A2096_11205 [Spirochaetes bacterium GWF1_41_5]
MSGGTPETMKMTHTVARQQTTALTEGDGNIFCLFKSEIFNMDIVDKYNKIYYNYLQRCSKR